MACTSGSGGGRGAGSCDLVPTSGTPSAADVRTWVLAYKDAHPGHGGKDWDINFKSAAELASDPDAARLLGLCGAARRPVIPLLAWEYGGSDHPWIAPEMSALAYCVYAPVDPSSGNWAWDPVADHVTADVYILFPDENPCRNLQGANLIAGCIGNPSNFEILVDLSAFNDGGCAGLSLSEASTELRLVLPDTTRTHLYDGQ